MSLYSLRLNVTTYKCTKKADLVFHADVTKDVMLSFKKCTEYFQSLNFHHIFSNFFLMNRNIQLVLNIYFLTCMGTLVLLSYSSNPHLNS